MSIEAVNIVTLELRKMNAGRFQSEWRQWKRTISSVNTGSISEEISAIQTAWVQRQESLQKTIVSIGVVVGRDIAEAQEAMVDRISAALNKSTNDTLSEISLLGGALQQHLIEVQGQMSEIMEVVKDGFNAPYNRQYENAPSLSALTHN